MVATILYMSFVLFIFILVFGTCFKILKHEVYNDKDTTVNCKRREGNKESIANPLNGLPTNNLIPHCKVDVHTQDTSSQNIQIFEHPYKLNRNDMSSVDKSQIEFFQDKKFLEYLFLIDSLSFSKRLEHLSDFIDFDELTSDDKTRIYQLLVHFNRYSIVNRLKIFEYLTSLYDSRLSEILKENREYIALEYKFYIGKRLENVRKDDNRMRHNRLLNRCVLNEEKRKRKISRKRNDANE